MAPIEHGLPNLTERDQHMSAFDRGQQAGRDQANSETSNPFLAGTPEHNNFEVGRRFGASNSALQERQQEKPHIVSSGEES